MEIIIKDAALTRTLEEIAEAYAAVCPDAYAAFCQIVEQESKNLVKPTGMSKQGHFMDVCRIPAHLYTFIRQQMLKRHGIDDFFRDRRHYDLLLKTWPACKIKRKPSKLFALKD